MIQKGSNHDSVLGQWAGWAGSHPGKVLLTGLIISILMGIGVSFLQMEMTFFSIMPRESRQVQDLKRITREFPFASTLVVVVDGRGLPAGEAKERVTGAIDEMTRVFSSPEFGDALKSVYSKVDQAYIKNHGFLLTKVKDLKRMEKMYADPDLLPFVQNLNDDLEREYSGDSDALEDDEMQVVSWVNGLDSILGNLSESLKGDLPDAEAVDRSLDTYLVGESYYLNRSENMGLLFLNPRYTVNDFGPLVTETNRIEERVKKIASASGLKAGMTGLTVVGRDEMVTSEQGFAVSMLVAMLLILALMIIVFRIRATPLIIGIPLGLGLFWTMGMTGLILHRLNIMTAMYLVALLGLGVDYAIHLMTGFVQERDRGEGFTAALQNAFAKSGRGIITGGMTTAAAFFALLLAESEMVRELAVVAGLGIFCELIAMLMLIPALLGWRQRVLDVRGKTDPMLTRPSHIRSDFADGLGRRISRHPGLWILVLLTAGILLSLRAPGVELEDNLMKMEARGLESVELQDVMTDEFGSAPDVLYYLSENPEELPPLIDALESLDSVKRVDAITQWIPTKAQREERLPYLNGIQSRLDGWQTSGDTDQELLLEELYRLEANLIEMGDLAVLGGTDRLAFVLNRVTGLDKEGKKVSESVFDRLFETLETGEDVKSGLVAFQSLFSPRLSRDIMTMANPEAVGPEDLPPMTRDTFLSGDGSTNLMTISPRLNPWEGRSRNIFTAQVNTVTERTTGMILAADQMIKIADSDGKKAVLAALIAVFLILLVDFRNLKLSLLTFLPLLLSFVSLYGIMSIFDIKLDFVNIIAIPLLVGIGIDDAVHINHRYLLEGKGKMQKALAATGSAVALTTITTVIGFASFIPSVMRAMRSTGIVLTLAMALAFIYSICLHPAILVMVSEKWGWNLEPRGKNKISEEKH